MISFSSRHWEHQEQWPSATVVTENALKIEVRETLVVFKEIQRLVLNCHSHLVNEVGPDTAQKIKQRKP